MENLRKSVEVRLISNARDYKKWVSRPVFVSQKIFSKTFISIHKIKPVPTLERPIYTELGILDLSKLLTNDFHCRYIKDGMGAALNYYS